MKMFLLLFVVLLCSCSKKALEFDPHFYVGDYKKEQIIDRDGLVVSVKDPEFNKYACMHEDKVAELNEIILRMGMPEDLRKIALDKLKVEFVK